MIVCLLLRIASSTYTRKTALECTPAYQGQKLPRDATYEVYNWAPG
jgi:hypothetical protein